MITYESTFICSPELAQEKIDELVEKAKKTIDSSKGTVILLQLLGKKRLAYPVKKFREGSYVYMELSGPGPMIASLENFYKVNDQIIRYLTIKVDKTKKPAKTQEAPKPASGEVATNEPTANTEAPRAE